jgi:TniQ
MDRSREQERFHFPWTRRGEQEQQRRGSIESFLGKLAPLPRRCAPQQWESLASLLSRTARKMGYQYPRWLLRPEQLPLLTIDPASLPLLERPIDYRYLSRLLLLEEEQLYALTLHRFARRFARPFPHLASQETGTRQLLSFEHRTQFFDSSRHTRVCPCCLDEGEAYDRLYWRCELVLSCARHRVLLIDRCPSCGVQIPALRPSPTACPSCRSGDYRSVLLPVPSEEQWLVESQATLLVQLGVDGPEAGERPPTNSATTIQSSPSWEYFQLLSLGLQVFDRLTSEAGVAVLFLTRSLGLDAVVERLVHDLRKTSPRLLRQHVLMHYLLSSWPVHFLVFLERLQRLLQEAYHYSSESPAIHRWNKSILQGKYWCLSEHQEKPVPHLQSFFDTFGAFFARLPPAEKAESSSREVLIVSIEQEKVSADEYTPPYPWESLTSVLMRIAGQKKYARLEWLLSSVGISDIFQLLREDLLLLRWKDDYDMFAQQFSLNRQALYTLTLHRFAPLLQPPEPTGRPLLSEKTAARYCMPQGTTKVCPVCLAEEPEAYERLYWNLRDVLICPRHLVFLIDRCPNCNCLIPTQVRSSITDCPYCHSGDYRAAVPASLAQDSLLYKSQQMLLRFLGVEELSNREISQPFHGSPLAGMSPWQYFDLLDHFRVVAPYLRPERALSAFCRSIRFPEEPVACLQRAQKQLAVQLSLFHALFVSWPGQVFTILGTEAGSLRPGEPGDEVCPFLMHAFEERRKYGQQAVWQRQEQLVFALARRGET